MTKLALDNASSVNESLFNWIKLYLRHKMMTLSTRLVVDRKSFERGFGEILGLENMASLLNLNTLMRRIGFDGFDSYFYPLRDLYVYLAQMPLHSLKDIDDSVIMEFLFFKIRHFAPSSAKRYKNIINNFFSFIEKRNADNYSFALDIHINIKHNAKLPRFLSKDDLLRITEYLKHSQVRKNPTKRASFRAARNSCMIKLILLTGMRSCEVAFLKKQDIRLQGDYYNITLLGKGNKYRNVVIKKDNIEQELETYLWHRESLQPHLQEKFLFINHRAQRISNNTVYRVVRQYLKATNLIATHKNGAHLLRHSYASLIYQESKDICLLQQLLGHSSIETTRIYTHLDNRAIIKASEYLDCICS